MEMSPQQSEGPWELGQPWVPLAPPTGRPGSIPGHTPIMWPLSGGGAPGTTWKDVEKGSILTELSTPLAWGGRRRILHTGAPHPREQVGRCC